jgi:hypothetical protein
LTLSTTAAPSVVARASIDDTAAATAKGWSN